MTPDRNEQHPVEESENSVLGDTGGIDTTGFGILGGATEQVSVVMPTDSDDDLDDDVLDDEVSPFEVQDVGAETPDEPAVPEPISEEIVAEIIPMGDDTDSFGVVDTSAEVLESADEFAFASDVEGDPVSDIETGRELTTSTPQKRHPSIRTRRPPGRSTPRRPSSPRNGCRRPAPYRPRRGRSPRPVAKPTTRHPIAGMPSSAFLRAPT